MQIRVLVADDSEAMRRAVRSLLDREPTVTVVGEVASYPELIETLSESEAEVVLMDIHMPGVNTLADFKAQLRGSCVLAMSFWTDEATASLAFTFGAVQLLDKSNLVSTLIPAIQECARAKKASLP
jgi:DNA-binding NarL/FixJ family response regulator